MLDKCKQENKFFSSHAPYSKGMEEALKRRGCVNFFVLRDPRDQLVSLMNHYKFIEKAKWLQSFSTDEEILLFIINNDQYFTDIRKWLSSYLAWISSQTCQVLSFDKLMGAHGGVATQEDAIEEMKKIARLLQLNYSDEYLQKVYLESFGGGFSFFKGKVGSWKDYFNEEHKVLIKNKIGDILIEFGFEENNDW